MFGSLACGAVLLAGTAACSDGPKERPAASNPSKAPDKQSQAPQTPAELLQQGVQQGQAGQADEAKKTFEKVLSLQADNKFAWFNLGYLAQSRGLGSEAVTNYDKALEIDGSYRPAMFNKALLLEAEKPDEALALYRKIVDADKAASTAYLRLGVMLDRREDQKGARAAFTSAVAADGSLASAVPAKYRPRKPAR
ncbi:tetratricopeptide repeat protein [Micromonospora sp. DT31]|uniref:tetratricopeptide repeat protein n=1 Tax=Micromonospora sp. DT31 TaxID=3393434 RepID=UPI003CEADAAF